MSRLTSDARETLARLRDGAEDWTHHHLRRQHHRPRHTGLPTGWLIAGVAVLAVGALAVYYIGPDVKRYMKIHNM